MNNWSPIPAAICEVCGWMWGSMLCGGCAYVVFWRDFSGWWFLVAMIFCGIWNCRFTAHPDQIDAIARLKQAEKESE